MISETRQPIPKIIKKIEKLPKLESLREIFDI